MYKEKNYYGVLFIFFLLCIGIFFFSCKYKAKEAENKFELTTVDEKDLEFTYVEENGVIKIWLIGFNKELYEGKKIHIDIPESISGEIIKKEFLDNHPFDEGYWETVMPLSENTLIANNNPVFGIEKNAFFNCDALYSISLPENLIVIEDGAFSFCVNLQNIDLPKKLKEIGMRAFSHCYSLKNIVIPKAITVIKWNTFSYCISLESIIFSDSITDIEQGAFLACSSLTDLSFPSTLARIWHRAFNACTSLKRITFPSTLVSVSSSFVNCPSLDIGEDGKKKAIVIECSPTVFEDYFLRDIEKRNKNLTIDNIKFAESWSDRQKYEHFPELFESFVMDSIEGPLIYGYDGESENDIKIYVLGFKRGLFEKKKEIIAIPDRVTGRIYKIKELYDEILIRNPDDFIDVIDEPIYGIGNNSFSYNDELKTVILPEGLKIIRDRAFFNCTNLEKITFPKTLVKVAPEAFGYCRELKDVTFFEGLTSIGSYAFYECANLTSITFPKTLTLIRGGAFYKCKKLETIIIPDSLSSIGIEAFYGCDSLKTIVMSKSFTKIAGGAFSSCKDLQTITLPEHLNTISSYAFADCTGFALGSDGKKKVIVINCSPDIYKEKVFQYIRGKKLGDDTEYFLTEENIEFNHPDWSLTEKRRVFEGSGKRKIFEGSNTTFTK